MILFPYQRKFFNNMDVYKPLRSVLLSYELLRLLFLAFSFAFFSSLQMAVKGEVFPYLVFLSSNAMFLLICFFLFLKPWEYRNYLPLYMAGKAIAVVSFFTWVVFSLFPGTIFAGPGFSDPGIPESNFFGMNSFMERMILLGCVFIISIGDTLSVFGTWILNRKLPETYNQNGGKGCA